MAYFKMDWLFCFCQIGIIFTQYIYILKYKSLLCLREKIRYKTNIHNVNLRFRSVIFISHCRLEMYKRSFPYYMAHIFGAIGLIIISNCLNEELKCLYITRNLFYFKVALKSNADVDCYFYKETIPICLR